MPPVVHRRPQAILHVENPTNTTQNRALVRQLNNLQNVPESERWPAADWPVDAAFDEARDFIMMLPTASIPLPNVGLADDGEVNFLWTQDGMYIDLGFYGTGVFSYYACSKDGQPFYGDDIPVSDGLPSDLEALLLR